MKDGAVQAARTITAFAVAILSCIVLWYSNVHKCASFFFAWQGLFPMQVEPPLRPPMPLQYRTLATP